MLTSTHTEPKALELADNTVNIRPALSPEATLVRNALVARGLETPLIDNGLNREQKLSIVRAGTARGRAEQPRWHSLTTQPSNERSSSSGDSQNQSLREREHGGAG